VYKLDPTNHETVLYNFDFRLDGGTPYGGVTLDATGNLYGTTWGGGPPATGFPGVVYKLDPTGNETVLYGFQGTTDGNSPRATLIFDSAGNLYGTTENGGQGPCTAFHITGCGVVFELDPTGHETVLYAFTGGSDGSEPQTGVIRDAAGNLYGTTSRGGTAGAGVVFKITPGVTGQLPSAARPSLKQQLKTLSSIPGVDRLAQDHIAHALALPNPPDKKQ
jgi:uncharacterized repeat protein (TIGR03803 family)